MLKYFNSDILLLNELEGAYRELEPQMSERIAKYRIYKDFFDGNHEPYLARQEGRRNHKTNLCAVAVREMKDFIIGDFFDLHVPRQSEVNYEQEFSKEPTDVEFEENRSEFIEKLLRAKVFTEPVGRRETENAVEDSLIYGDGVLFCPYKEKRFAVQAVFPGYVRFKFSSVNYDDLEAIIYEQVLSIGKARALYGQELQPDTYSPLIFWDRIQRYGDYTVIKTYYDDKYIVKWANNKIISKSEHGYSELPFKIFPAFRNPHSPLGDSYLKDIIPIQKEFNEAISDEADIAKIYANPKAILTNASKKEVDQLKKMWKSGLIASQRPIDLKIVEFKNTLFPIAERVRSILDRFYKVSGLPPVIFGMPEGSINTGPALTVQFAPTVRKARHIWRNWEPRLFQLIEFFLKEFEKKGGRVGEKSMKEIIGGNYEVQLVPKFMAPRDESLISTVAINELQAGLISKLTAMKKIGVKSPENEQEQIAYEMFNPIISPEKVANLQAAIQSGSPVQGNPGPVTPAMPTESPPAGGRVI